MEYRKWAAIKYRVNAKDYHEIIKTMYFRTRRAAKARSLKWDDAAERKRRSSSSKEEVKQQP
jgi:hypothetical protein